ncbi:MAG: hypothetical protein AAGB04_08885 [Pseudomonadota bacterium]
MHANQVYKKLLGWIAFGVVATVVTTVAAQAQVIVLQSTVGKFKAGSTLAKSTQVSIPAGGSMTVVLASGATRKINGPFSGKVSSLSSGGASNAALFNAVKDYIKTGGSSRKKVGALRSIAPRGNSPAASSAKIKFSWTSVPVSASGDYCVEKGAPIKLKRLRAGRPTQITLVDLQSTRRVQLNFGSADSEVDWPSELPVRNASYAILAKGRAMKQVRLRLIAPIPPADQTLQVLHGQRCSLQFAAYLRGFSVTQQ